MKLGNGAIGNLLSVPRAQILRALSSGEKSVGELVRETGLSQPNLSNHLSRLKQQGLVQPRRDGRRIFYSLTDPRLQEWISREHQAERTAETAPPPAIVYAEYLDALLRWDAPEAEALLMKAESSGLAWKTIYPSILLLAMRQIGDWWETGQISVAHEHAVSELTQRMMSRLKANGIVHDDTAPCAMVGCVAGEQHSIGARMASDFLEDAGWRVIYLGANVPLEEYCAMMDRHQPRLAVLSVTLSGLETVALKTVATLRQRFDETRLRILVGGSPAERSRDCFRNAGVDAIANDPPHSAACAATWFEECKSSA